MLASTSRVISRFDFRGVIKTPVPSVSLVLRGRVAVKISALEVPSNRNGASKGSPTRAAMSEVRGLLCPEINP